MNEFLYILFPVVIAFLSYLGNDRIRFIFIIFSEIIFTILSVYLFINVHDNGTIIRTFGNYDYLVGISIRIDLLSSLLILTTSILFLGLLVYNYHRYYMNKLFLFLFILLQGLINGIFLSADLFNIYVFIEVSTIVVSILIMFKRDSQSIYDGMVYLLTNVLSMCFFLLAVGFTYKIFGTLNMIELKALILQIEDIDSIKIPYALFMTAVGLKAAIMPLFSWLPKAHGTPSAPSVVSAVLSGLYVKGGVYLYIRFHDMFQPIFDSSTLFLVAGYLTAIVGFIYALSQTDLKLILAYHTVSQIGLIIVGLNIGETGSFYGAIYHILNHAIFKTVLCLTAGILISVYNVRDVTKIRGVLKSMPFVGISIIVAIFGITGAPLFNGSISKYLIQHGTVKFTLSYYLMLFINLGTIISFIKYSQVLFGETSVRHDIRWNQKLVIGLLSLICFVGGIFGEPIVNYIFSISMHIDSYVFIEKGIIYVISLIIGVLFYRYIYHHMRLFKEIRSLDLTFNTICMSIVIFFFTLLVI